VFGGPKYVADHACESEWNQLRVVFALLVLLEAVPLVDVQHVAVRLVDHDVAHVSVAQSDKLPHCTHHCERSGKVGDLEVEYFCILAPQKHAGTQVHGFLYGIAYFFKHFVLLRDSLLFEVGEVLVDHQHFHLLSVSVVLAVVFDQTADLVAVSDEAQERTVVGERDHREGLDFGVLGAHVFTALDQRVHEVKELHDAFVQSKVFVRLQHKLLFLAIGAGQHHMARFFLGSVQG